jgi:hypothetical protein
VTKKKTNKMAGTPGQLPLIGVDKPNTDDPGTLSDTFSNTEDTSNAVGHRTLSELSVDGETSWLEFFCSKNSLPLIHPYHPYLLAWQMLLLVAIIYNCLYVPYDLTFGSIESFRVLDDISDTIFLLDIIVTFHTCLVAEEEMEEYVIADRAIISRQYFWSNFIVDGKRLHFLVHPVHGTLVLCVF